MLLKQIIFDPGNTKKLIRNYSVRQPGVDYYSG